MIAAAHADRVRPSQALLRFTAELPHERESILEFALRVAAELAPGSRLIDVGAGNSPYRELFSHLRYESSDWEHSPHPGAHHVDHVGPAHDLPVDDSAYDGVLCTQVLEHVPSPDAVARELYRILRPGGRLYLTVPLAWELHEMPFDFYRYTPYGLARILGDAGFQRLDIAPRNDCFRTLAQLLGNLPTMIGRYPDGRNHQRAEAEAVLRAMAAKVASYSGLDSNRIFPLGYSVVALRPETGPRSAASVDRDAVGLGQARRFVTLCFACDVFADPRLLAGYAKHFSGHDDATLVIYAPHADPPSASQALMDLVGALGLDGPESPDMIGLPFINTADEAALAGAVDGVLARRPPWGAFSGRPWVHAGNLAETARRAAGGRVDSASLVET